MAEEITVQLFPPQPAGMAIQNAPLAGGSVVVPVPMYEYARVKDVLYDTERKCISFTNRQGDRIESTLPWIVKRSYTGEADA